MSEAKQAPAKLPGSLNANRRLSQWLRFDRKGFVEALPGKVEIGQGIVTALHQIVADELDVPLERVRMIRASTATRYCGGSRATCARGCSRSSC